MGTESDWRRAVEIAREEGVTASDWYTLDIVQMLGTPIRLSLIQQLQLWLVLRMVYRCVWPTRGIVSLRGHMRRRAVQFHVADSWRGMLPSLVLLGHRRQRLRSIADAVFHRSCWNGWRALGALRLLANSVPSEFSQTREDLYVGRLY